jgi:hypothetical protein
MKNRPEHNTKLPHHFCEKVKHRVFFFSFQIFGYGGYGWFASRKDQRSVGLRWPFQNDCKSLLDAKPTRAWISEGSYLAMEAHNPKAGWTCSVGFRQKKSVIATGLWPCFIRWLNPNFTSPTQNFESKNKSSILVMKRIFLGWTPIFHGFNPILSWIEPQLFIDFSLKIQGPWPSWPHFCASRT